MQEAYTIDIDHRGELLVYREAERQTDVICTWWGTNPVLVPRTLKYWWYPAQRRTRLIDEAERQVVLDRILETLRSRGAVEVEIED